MCGALALVAGACSGGDPAPADDARSPALPSWSALTDAPAARAGAAVAVADGLLYVAGGVGPDGLVRSVSHYDPAVNAWTSAPDLPVALREAAAVGRGEEVIVLGGFTDAAGTVPSARVFSLKGGAWKELPRMRTARGALGAALVKGAVYAIGGLEANGRASRRVEILTGASWGTGPALPTARSHLGVAAGERYIYAIGGRIGERARREVERYDTATDRWQRRARLRTARSHLVAIGGGNTVLAIGGTSGAPDGALQTIETYAAGSDAWSEFQPPLPRALRSAGAGVVDTRIIVTGGSGAGPRAFTARTIGLSTALSPLLP